MTGPQDDPGEAVLNPELAFRPGHPPDDVQAKQVPAGAWDLAIGPAGEGAHPLFVVAVLLPRPDATRPGHHVDQTPRWLAVSHREAAVRAAALRWQASAATLTLSDRIRWQPTPPRSTPPAGQRDLTTLLGHAEAEQLRTAMTAAGTARPARPLMAAFPPLRPAAGATAATPMPAAGSDRAQRPGPPQR
ncbi:hypothetical protein [Actinoplanes sp. L3-i22]|uniref:hypothetical protein n=1 Tax=Actinoplanes sp. L3-i22 TaxID=2836373 RepID=UPI001C785E56|nr:hypothetical protein [Actinoplanes sp. L3-i22]BCY10980.1 hypothetical protein L3i22_060680 [Actinoplanes sp. L3-i22]